MMFPDIAKGILRELLGAEEARKPITLAAALKKWGNGSTWEDLVDGGYVYRTPEAVTVTPIGKKYLGIK